MFRLRGTATKICAAACSEKRTTTIPVSFHPAFKLARDGRREEVGSALSVEALLVVSHQKCVSHDADTRVLQVGIELSLVFVLDTARDQLRDP